MALSTGEIIDQKYRIVRLIGEGGMGAVYEGENMRIHRRVAIKVLHSGVATSADAVQRFEREAQAAGRIGSEHIVEVLDLGHLADGDRYMVMEFMDGDSLSDRLQKRGHLPPTDLYPIACQLLDGLAAAHGSGIIHRDLKPDNVFLLRSRSGKADFVKLLDFGISKFNQLSGESGFSMTRTGAVMGTPYYMAPEQAKGAKNIDHRVDLYAAGVILYECLTGQVPFRADTLNELLFKIVLEEPAPLEQLAPGIDPNFAAIVRKAMAREPSERFASAEEFRHTLDQWAAGTSVNLQAPDQAGVAGTPAVTGFHAAGARTPGSWSEASKPDVTPAPKRKTGLVIGLVAAASVLLLAGGGTYLKVQSDAKQAAAALAKAEAEQRAQEELKRREAELQQQREEAERARVEAERARAEAERAAEEAKKLRSGAERAQAEREAELKAEAAAAAEARARLAKTRTTTKNRTASAATTAAPATKSTGASTTSGSVAGRKIRTDL